MTNPSPAGFTPEQWPRIAELFDEALTLPQADRAPWLQALAGREPALSHQVARLLEAHAAHETHDWLASGPRLGEADLQALGGGTEEPESHRLPGQCLGPYQLIERVARGGMGEVWRARALQLPGQRVVALKLPLLHRPGAASAARFAREGEILAALEHPHIARLYDAGQAEDGMPYLAIEWIVGEHLGDWCAAQGLGLRQRLLLFLQVLDAVAFAHARLVLHRDLKPSNILVGADGRVKLLDFGIAKLLDAQARSESTELTRAAGRVMTTAYAAPEQVRGETLTPATDVYALGVVLFELLTGERPYRLRLDTPAQLEQAIVSGDLLRPGELQRALRGDIDAIIGRALASDPMRRYAGAQAMAEDIRRHLDGQPVLAQASSWHYLAGRFVRRHRAATGAAGAVLAALLVGGGVALWQALRADQERDRAVAAAAVAQAAQRFMRDLLDDAARAGRPLKVAELMARAEAQARDTLAGRPDDLAAVLGLVASELATRDPPRAAALYAEAASSARQSSLQAALECSARATEARNQSPEAAKQRLRGLVADSRLTDEARTTCRLTLAQLLIQNGDVVEAEPLVETAWLRLAPLGDDAWREQVWALTMQTYLRTDGRGAGLDARVAPVLQRLARQGRDRGPAALGLYNTWGTLALVSGEPLRAAERYGAIVQRMDEDLPAPGASAYDRQMLASALIAAGRLDEAAAALERGIAQAHAAGDAPSLFGCLCLRGRVAALAGQPEASARAYAEAAAVPNRGEPLRRNALPFCAMGQAESLVLAGQPAAALQKLQPLLAAGPPPSVRLAIELVQAEAELGLAQAEAAGRTAAQAEQTARRLQADNRHSARTGQALALQALALGLLGDAAAATTLMAQAREHLNATTDERQRWRRLAQDPDASVVPR